MAIRKLISPIVEFVDDTGVKVRAPEIASTLNINYSAVYDGKYDYCVVVFDDAIVKARELQKYQDATITERELLEKAQTIEELRKPRTKIIDTEIKEIRIR